MQNKSPLQVKSALLCVPGCPLLLAARLRTGSPLLLPSVSYFSAYSQDNPFSSLRPVISIGHHLVCFSQSYPSVQEITLRDPWKTLLSISVSLPRCPFPLTVTCWEPLWSSLYLPLSLPFSFVPGSYSVLFLSEPSTSIWYFSASVSLSIKWWESGRLKTGNPSKALRMPSSYSNTINEWVSVSGWGQGVEILYFWLLLFPELPSGFWHRPPGSMVT